MFTLTELFGFVFNVHTELSSYIKSHFKTKYMPNVTTFKSGFTQKQGRRRGRGSGKRGKGKEGKRWGEEEIQFEMW